MSRNRHRVTHFEGDDCDPPHPPIPTPTCACTHPRTLHRLIADRWGRCLTTDCPCPMWRTT